MKRDAKNFKNFRFIPIFFCRIPLIVWRLIGLSQIAKELSDITTISSGNFQSWPKANDFDPNIVLSVGELRGFLPCREYFFRSHSKFPFFPPPSQTPPFPPALKWRKKAPQEWAGFNVKHFSRIYPRGSRFDSSNYSPISFWCVGSQMVALNYQVQHTFRKVDRIFLVLLLTFLHSVFYQTPPDP
jgi:hypothetical protein